MNWDGEWLNQSMAIARFLARQFNLAGNDTNIFIHITHTYTNTPHITHNQSHRHKLNAGKVKTPSDANYAACVILTKLLS